jgi:hypothetical protein
VRGLPPRAFGLTPGGPCGGLYGDVPPEERRWGEEEVSWLKSVYSRTVAAAMGEDDRPDAGWRRGGLSHGLRGEVVESAEGARGERVGLEPVLRATGNAAEIAMSWTVAGGEGYPGDPRSIWAAMGEKG